VLFDGLRIVKLASQNRPVYHGKRFATGTKVTRRRLYQTQDNGLNFAPATALKAAPEKDKEGVEPLEWYGNSIQTYNVVSTLHSPVIQAASRSRIFW
jgi:hypothetical protein